MSKIISSEKSPFIEKNIEIYAKNKVGQFSKYLGKNPIFVTYYHLNQEMSRADTGTGSVKEPIGKDSPLRYNEIKDFPIHNFPELKPDVSYDDTQGIDTSMDLSGMVILPNTVKPIPDDFMYFKFPGMRVGILMRVTNFEYNTIQSNDFYTINCELRAIVRDDETNNTYTQLMKQVVEHYVCIFDNIGTEDKCLIKIQDLELAKTTLTFINELRDSYYDAYYRKDVGTFTAFGMWTTTPTYLYDLYLIKFLKESRLFFDESGQRMVCLNYDECIPLNFENTFKRTLWYAVLKKTQMFLNRYSYYQVSGVIKTVSPFRMIDYDTEVIHLDLPSVQVDPRLSRSVGGVTREYFPVELTNGIKDGNLQTSGYFDQIIFNYVRGIQDPIDIDKLMECNMEQSMTNFLQLPLIIYILQQNYNAIFHSDSYQEVIT